MQISNLFRGFSQPLRPTFFVIIILAIFFPLLAFFLWRIETQKVNDLILIIWIPGQELMTTGSVSPDYPYPMWTVVMLLPFAMLEPKTAMVIWLIFNLLMLIASLFLFIRIFEWDVTGGLFALLVFTFSTYFPALVSLDMGQLSVFSLFVLALAIYFYLHQRWVWLGIALGVSFIKPQVIPLVAGLLLLWALLQKRWQMLIGFGSTMAVMILASLPFISSPSQIIGGGIGSHLSTYIRWTATLWALFMNWGVSWYVPLFISVALLFWVGWLWLPFLLGRETSVNRVRFLISIAVIVNLLVIPYNWIYNLILLLVPFGYSLSLVLKIKNWQKYAWLASLFAVMYLITMGLIIIFRYDFQFNESQAFHITHALVLLAIMTYLEHRTNSAGT